MQRRSLFALLPVLAGGARALAQDAPAGRDYVVLALVSEKLSFVEKTGGNSDPTQNRPRTAEVPLPGSPYDTAALQAIAQALPLADPGAHMAFLAASAPEYYADQDDWFEGDTLKLPAKLRQAVAGERAGLLLLLTKWRGEAAISDGKPNVVSGKIAGLGFYRFARREGTSREETEVHGYIAPFVYARLSLVDVATSRVLQTRVIQAATPYPGDLSPQKQIDTLVAMLGAGVRDAVPLVVRRP